MKGGDILKAIKVYAAVFAFAFVLGLAVVSTMPTEAAARGGWGDFDYCPSPGCLTWCRCDCYISIDGQCIMYLVFEGYYNGFDCSNPCGSRWYYIETCPCGTGAQT